MKYKTKIKIKRMISRHYDVCVIIALLILLIGVLALIKYFSHIRDAKYLEYIRHTESESKMNEHDSEQSDTADETPTDDYQIVIRGEKYKLIRE
ncbi:hypothetical protein [Ruminococcus albus]|uniref:Uncharacterized protein n=1 Tax=Ruminococcus albus TaxID=1264 RepID=A0A1I1PL56_RUMAL|nr:hypothetical protein [Ruminococcus albus]SFD10565.1 hypothetical protein SAMN02910406_03114 [Ruminococcus albus]